MTPYQHPDHLSACSLTELVLGGDWACGQNLTASLGEVARHLALHSRPPDRERLLEVARLCDADEMMAATELWLVATAPLRGGRHAPGPRRDDPPSPS